MSGRPRGFVSWTPDFHTSEFVADTLDVRTEAEANGLLPIGPRTIEYGLLDRGYLKTQGHRAGAAPSPKAKTEKQPSSDRLYQRAKTVLVKMRRARIIPMPVIADDFYVERAPLEFDGPEAFMAHVRRIAEQADLRPLLTGQPIVPVLWCEARGMVAGVVNVAHPYGVTVLSCGGSDHLGLKHDIPLEAVNQWLRTGQRTEVCHLGDHDDKGVEIFEVLSEVSPAFAAGHLEDPGMDTDKALALGEHIIKVTRIGLTDDQLDEYDIADKNQGYEDGTNGSGMLKVQAEAIPFAERRALIADAIEDLLDLDLLDETRATSDWERTELLATLDVAATGRTTDEQGDASP